MFILTNYCRIFRFKNKKADIGSFLNMHIRAKKPAINPEHVKK